ncbi:hypothetical protein IMSAG249_01512 [Lachnospiraceae bacterium]|jgi:KAP family P-loop domain.|nr:hypothetical protein IMSAGC009_02870 [Lachnospiraceae bacterium]GFI69687.1 hypothetical protein IMSAG249_01512 [Lachnospiraceae bacterium]
MNGKQIESEVIRYLGDNNYRYAILIEGEWGCGKTYFVLNSLQTAITEYEATHSKRKVRYISLYGCKSVAEIEENLYWSIVDEQFYNKYEQLTHFENYYGKEKEKRQKNGKIITNISKKMVSSLMQRFEISSKAYEFISDFLSLNKNIFIFDDLERCDCPPNDILGYINGLVEHEGAKVILIANEREIGTLTQVKNKELQYLVSFNEKIKIPKEESTLSYRHINNTKDDLDIDELERRRKKLFSDNEYNQQYLRIREKLIGQTLRYEADLVAIIHKLINKCKSDTNLKKHLDDNVKYFIDVMSENEHDNLRTFQFFLSKIEYLYTYFLSFEIDNRYKNAALDFIIQNCFMICVEHRGNVQGPEDQFLQICFQNKRRMTTILNYVKYSIFDSESFLNDVIGYINAELASRLPDNDPYTLLYDQYYLQTQDWVEEKIKLILEKLRQNEYDSNLYPNILIIFTRLVKYGFHEEILLYAEEYMVSNVKHGKNNILDDCIASDKPEEITKCKEIIHRINSQIRSSRESSRAQDILKILNDNESWAGELNNYWNINRQHIPHEIQILSYADTDFWLQKILDSSAENIHQFRIFLNSLYPDNVVKANVEDDILVIQSVLNKLEAYEDSDKIRNMQLTLLKGQLSQIHKRHIEYMQKISH